MKKTVDPTPADPGKKDPTPTPVKKDGVISVTDKAAIETKKQLQRVAMTMKQLHMYAYLDSQWLQSQQLHIARKKLANKTAFKLNIL